MKRIVARSNSIQDILLSKYSDIKHSIYRGILGLMILISDPRISLLKFRFLAVVYLLDSNIAAFILGIRIGIRIGINISIDRQQC